MIPWPGLAESETLRRFVGFLASAFDARYAFVAAVEEREDAWAPRTLVLWLTRDFGLYSKSLRLEGSHDLRLDSPRPDYLPALRRAWPDEGELLRLTASSCVIAPLTDAGGGLLGHIGILGTGVAARHGSESLGPLAELAAAKLQPGLAFPREPG